MCGSPGKACSTMANDSGCGTAAGRHKTASHMLYTAVVAPIPRARVKAATAVTDGARSNWRAP